MTDKHETTPNSLATFEATLRQVDVAALSPLARQVFDYAFPIFNEVPFLTPAARVAFAKGGKVERPYNYRRFAGGAELPRGCYSSVCVDESGRDNGTLVCELTNYADAKRSGEVHVFEGFDPLFTDRGAGWLGVFPGYRPAPDSIVVAFTSRPNAPHPLLVPDANPLGDRAAGAAFRQSAPQSDRGVILLEVPTRFRRIRLDKVFDLRRLENQNLLNKWAREKLAFTVFVYSTPFDGPPPIDPKKEIPKDYPWVIYYGPPNEKPSEPWSSDFIASLALRADATDDGTFLFLLHFLLSPGRGGSPVTEAIGATLRIAGARGLVYPSARNDILCGYQDDELTAHSGWCFVDYSAFKLARPCFRIIRDPKLWWGRDPLSFALAPADSPEAGSWEMLGVRQRLQQHHNKRIEAWYASEREKVMLHLTKRWWQFWIR